MEVLLLARFFALVRFSVLFRLGASVTQPKAGQTQHLTAADGTRLHNAAGLHPKASGDLSEPHTQASAEDFDHTEVPASQEAANANPIGSESKGKLRRDRTLIHGHVNGRGIYVSNAKVGVLHEDASSTLQRSDSAPPQEKASPVKIQQPASFMKRELLHEEADPLEADEEQWEDLQPMALAEGSSAETMDASFNWWDRRRRRRRVDCTWSAWQGWSECTMTCSGGEKQRNRMTNGPHWAGKVCDGPKSEYSTCNTQNCGVDCEWNTWGAWGPCSSTCGGGMRIRQRGHLPFTDRDGGHLCDYTFSKRSGVCNSFSCPIPCTFAAWNYWGGCSQTCGVGIKQRTRDKIGPLHGGAPCQASALLEEKCNAFSCPVDCTWNTWGGWGTCSKTCGGGIKLRERAYLAQASNGGGSCPGSPAEILACNVQDCAQDCLWSEWHDPGPCTKTCGGGAFTRHRARKQESVFGGVECTGPNTEIGPCNVEPCAQDCLYDEWQPFGECSQSCGGGTHTAKRNGTAAMYGGQECSDQNSSKEEECNTMECPAITIKAGTMQQSLSPVLLSLSFLATSFLLTEIVV